MLQESNKPNERIDESKLAIVKLIGLSQKGKNRVREHGKHWFVLREEPVIAHPEFHGACLLIRPCCDFGNENMRWVQAINDSDFIVEETDKWIKWIL